MSVCYVAVWCDDTGEWGWQCFICHEEAAGFDSFDSAEAACGEHLRATAEAQR